MRRVDYSSFTPTALHSAGVHIFRVFVPYTKWHGPSPSPPPSNPPLFATQCMHIFKRNAVVWASYSLVVRNLICSFLPHAGLPSGALADPVLAERMQAERLAAMSGADPLMRLPPHSSAPPGGGGPPSGLQHSHTHSHTHQHLHLHQQANELHGK